MEARTRARPAPGRLLSHPALLAGLCALVLSQRPVRAETLECPACVVSFPPHARAQAEQLLAGFGPQRDSAAVWLGFERAGRPVLHLVEGLEEMRALTGPATPSWSVAVCRRDDVIAFRLDRVDRTPYDRLALVLAHEVVHQVLNHTGGARPPRWFEEGLAVYHAGVPFLEADYSLERTAAAGNLPRFADADGAFLGQRSEAATAYRASHSVVLFFLERHGPADLRALLGNVAAGQPFEAAFLEVTGQSLPDFELAWREAVTPDLPFLLFVLLENLELTLLVLAAVAVVAGYVRWRLRRERALRQLEEP